MLYVITTHMPGYLSESDDPPFEATPGGAILALLDEADWQMDAIADGADDDDEVVNGDIAFVESLGGSEGRADLLATLTRHGQASIRLESYANRFGGIVTVAEYHEHE